MKTMFEPDEPASFTRGGASLRLGRRWLRRPAGTANQATEVGSPRRSQKM